jgi:lysophospholipase L1-like esterase
MPADGGAGRVGKGRAGSPPRLRSGQASPALTIVALGDSTTAGTPGFRSPLEAPPDGEGDVTSQFTWWLTRAEPEWRVLNRGVNGERTDEIAARFDRDVLAHAPHVLTAGSASRPSLVLVLLAGVNDVYQGRDAAAVQAHLLAMYTRARDARIPVVACSIIPFDTATPDQNARMHAINAWIRQTASSTPGMAYCDTRAAAAMPGDIDRLCETPDGLHPTAAGYRRMADALLPVLRSLA